MSNALLLIDNIAFAKRNEHLTGSLSLDDCPRLTELLASHAPDAANYQSNKHARNGDEAIKFTLNGEVNAAGQHFLHLALTVSLATYCQRCMAEMPLTLDLHFDYLISDMVSGELDAAGQPARQPASRTAERGQSASAGSRGPAR